MISNKDLEQYAPLIKQFVKTKLGNTPLTTASLRQMLNSQDQMTRAALSALTKTGEVSDAELNQVIATISK